MPGSEKSLAENKICDLGTVDRSVKDYHASQTNHTEIISSCKEINNMEDNNNNLDCVRTYLDTHASVVVLGKIFYAKIALKGR